MAESKKIMLSGVKPTGRPHLGNYFGAMRQLVSLQAEHETLVMVADYHALTTTRDPAQLKADTLGIALDYLAIGLDPSRVTLFKQSDVPEHTELAWIFNCLTTMPYLMRAHAYKDAEAKNKEVSVGLFDYPLLMAADILLYDAGVVPVGQDQKQHLEIARDVAEKFNREYGETFAQPEPLILETVKTVPGVDGQKMSKSYGNTIPLFASDEEIKKLVMSIVTDSAGGLPRNVFEIHKLLKPEAELQALYSAKQGSYKELKEALAADLIAFITPLRQRREEIAAEPEKVIEILKRGGEQARSKAAAKMSQVRGKIGVTL